MKVVSSWSGGKDSALACYKAISQGLSVSFLINTISNEKRTIAHGLNPELIALQSKLIEIPIVQIHTSWDTYEKEFKIALNKIKKKGIEGVIFGDLDEIPDHKNWTDRVCKELGLQAINPLWGLKPEQVVNDLINNGFKAIVIKAKADLLGEEWLGRMVNKQFLTDLQKLNKEIDLCGEFGEYHTFVIDGPLFKRSIKIIEGNKLLKDGYWTLDIKKIEIFEK